MAESARQKAERRGVLIAASIAIHAAILLPLALSSPKLRAPPNIDVLVLPLDLTPWPSRHRRGAVKPGPAPARDVEAVVAGRAEDPRLRVPSVSAPASAPAASAAGSVIEDGWRVRAGLGPPARLPCPAAPGDRLGQRLCLVGSAPDRDRDPDTYAEVAPSRRDRSDQAREEGFDRQVQANEAWRDYTRGDGAYPGLRSLFSER